MPADGYTTPTEIRPPAADIPGAIAQTRNALLLLTDADLFERIAVVCLRDFAPSLRQSGGSGDEQRDGVGGSLRVDGDKLVLTVSLEKESWAKKVERDLDGLAKHGHKPEVVWSVTNRKTGAQRRTSLEKGAPARWGHALKVLDVNFLALRLMHPDLLAARGELLGLPAPTWPITRSVAAFAAAQPSYGAPPEMFGRQQQVEDLLDALANAHLVVMAGTGGVGKTRLATEVAPQVNVDRVHVLDAATPSESDRLHAEIAGDDRLLLIVDNAHRRDDLAAIVSIVDRRSGDTRLLLLVRPGFDDRIARIVADSRFADASAQRWLMITGLSNRDIGDLVRAAEPELTYTDAVQEIVTLAEGNPLIALLAHRVAVNNGGLHGLSRGEVLSTYAAPVIDAVAATRPEVSAADYRDCLALVALLGGVDDDGVPPLAEHLEIPRRQVRLRLDDLTDAGLLVAGPTLRSVTPDLLAAQFVRDAWFAERAPSVPFEEVWNGCDEDRRSAICSSIGGLAGFALEDRGGVSDRLSTSLRTGARDAPLRTLAQAESIAPGLPGAALAAVDAVLLAPPPGDTEPWCVAALGVCDRVADFAKGWPRQLSLAEAYYAGTPDGASRAPRDALTQVYRRLPINTSRYDGHVLDEVQRLLVDLTAEWAAEHAGCSGSVPALALAAEQLLRVSSERSFLSAEDDRRVVMGAGFLPPSDRTAAALISGARLLLDTVGQLGPAAQIDAVKPVAALRRCAAGHAAAYGSVPDDGLQQMAASILDQLTDQLAGRRDLPLATRSSFVDALDRDPWPDDTDLTNFRDLLIGRPRSGDGLAARSERLAHVITKVDDADGVERLLARWRAWLAEADEAGLRHVGGGLIPAALATAAAADPARVRDALEAELRRPSRFAELTGGALAVLLAMPEGEELAARLLVDAVLSARVAVTAGLAGVNDAWADELLARLGEDPEPRVRSRVAATTGWTDSPSETRILTGLRACAPGGLDDALMLLAGLGRDEDVTLTEEAATIVAGIASAAACGPRVDGDGLRELCERSGRPRLALDLLLARVAWLNGAPDDFEAEIARDALPDELADLAAAAAVNADVDALVGLLESAETTGSARSAAVRLLCWIDPGDLLTDRLAEWLGNDDQGRTHAATEILRGTRDPDAFRARAQRLLSVAPALDLTDLLLEARQPTWWIGAELTVLRGLVEEFSTWASSNDVRLAEVGRAGMARYTTRADAADEAEDPLSRWG